jgi:hypothetical protein
MSHRTGEVNVSIGSVFPTVLAVLFIGLKLTGHITWPWIWVLAPIWIPAALALFFVALLFLLYAFVSKNK